MPMRNHRLRDIDGTVYDPETGDVIVRMVPIDPPPGSVTTVLAGYDPDRGGWVETEFYPLEIGAKS